MKRSIPSALAVALFCLLQACDLSNQVSNGGGDETHSNIDIQGVVLTGRSAPFAGIVVKLRSVGLSDTTDSRGTYAIQADRAIAAGRALAVVDTLDFYSDGRIVHSELLATWVEQVPDVILVQRDVSGKLTGNVADVKTVDVVFGGLRADTLSLEWNPVLGSYSGFAYFEWSGEVASYQMRIEARDSLHRLVGRSVDIPFTSRAGDLAVPTFDAGNARPRLVLQGPDSAQSREVLRISAVGSDAFGQMVIVRWPDQGNMKIVNHVMPSGTDSVWVVHCDATDAEGLVTRDSLVIRRKLSPPTASVTAIVSGDSVRIHLTTSDVNNGAIREKRVFLGMAKTSYRGMVMSGCVQVVPVFETDWETRTWKVESEPGACTDNKAQFWTSVVFQKLDSGFVMTRNDTVLYIPKSDSGDTNFQVALVVTDEDGEVTVKRSATFKRDSVAVTVQSVSERSPASREAPNLVAIEPVVPGSRADNATGSPRAPAGKTIVFLAQNRLVAPLDRFLGIDCRA